MPTYLVLRTITYYMDVDALTPDDALAHAESKMNNTPESDEWICSEDDLEVVLDSQCACSESA